MDELSEAIRPQDDLFGHVNQRWIERTVIPADQAIYGAIAILVEEAERSVREIIESAHSAPEGSEQRKLGHLYASFLDEPRVELRGAAPLSDRLARVDAVGSIEELLDTIGELQRGGLAGFYGLFVNNDPGDPARYRVFLEQGGISLPDESYYREDQFAAVRDAFEVHVTRMLGLAGRSEPEVRAQRVRALETEIARHHWDNVAARDAQKTYNLFEWRAASDLFDDVTSARANDVEAGRLDRWLANLNVPSGAFDQVVLRQPSFTRGLGELLDDAHLDAWRDWLSYQVVRGDAPYLSSDFVAEHFDFYGRTLTGALELRERWKRGVSLVEGALGEAVGRIYVERHFPPAAKTRIDDLVRHLIEAYRASIITLEWMSEATRQSALAKLNMFTPKIGFPVKWRDYSSLEISATDLIANVRAASAFEFDRELAKVASSVDRDEWFMTPQTINAYYNPGLNEIVFPAAILQPPLFDADRDDAANYGAIGAVIGHEIGHGFDDQGSKYDGTGRLRDWWAPADRTAFEQRTHALIDQYDALTPRQSLEGHVNGALTIGENIGDLGGLGIAWRAYRLSLRGGEPPVIDGLTGAERFFLAWAQVWRTHARPEEVGRRLAIDPHSPDEFRCNQIVRNLDAFYETFGVRPSDQLWLDPLDRVTIW